MNFGGCGEEAVHDADWPADRRATRHDPAPRIGDRSIHGQDSAFKAIQQSMPEPVLISVAAASYVHALDAEAQLSQRYYAQK